MHITRLYFDIEKEINWLNEISSKGYRLKSRSWFTYEFEPCEAGKYVYQVEKRNKMAIEENREYIDFLEELDIRWVTNQWGWYYFEKLKDEEDFILFTDSKSKSNHYYLIIKALIIIGIINCAILLNTYQQPVGYRGPYILDISIPIVINTIMLIQAIRNGIKYKVKINRLKKACEIIEEI